MRPDTDPDWLRMISIMTKTSKTLPDDYYMVGAVQLLADLLCDLEPILSHEQLAVLLGIGALMVREGKAEAIAGITAALALQRAGGKAGR